MAIISTEEVRDFASRLDSMASSIEGQLEGLRGSVRGVGGGWGDDRYDEFSSALDGLCRSLDPFYDEARTYSKNLNTKADLNDRTAGHGPS